MANWMCLELICSLNGGQFNNIFLWYPKLPRMATEKSVWLCCRMSINKSIRSYCDILLWHVQSINLRTFGRENKFNFKINLNNTFRGNQHKNRNKLRVYWWKMTSSCHPVIIVYTPTQSLRGIRGKSTTTLKWKCDNFNINTPPRRYSISGRMCHYYSTWSIYFGKSASQEATFWSLSHSQLCNTNIDEPAES